MGIGYLAAPKENHKVLEKTRPQNARHARPTGEWICPGACILVLCYGSNRFTGLGKSKVWKKICVDEHGSNGKETSKGWTTPTENHWSSEFRGLYA